ncbi:coniferyl aldehyde dehydrogenase [Acinetobacter nectaris]|uniref:coniferyl aldehyde dehydrogenase n=1 Tax=Acinetobacter nectaris TaxID=1219382 RepID=UPI001F20AA98|nr:coniferyl aldehyde dehydrogenase [Acinetobacter nectaris]
MPTPDHTNNNLQADALNTVFKQQQVAYQSETYPTYDIRKQRLTQLYTLILNNQEKIADAICKDFSNRSHDETRLVEIVPSLSGIKYCLKHLKKWMQPDYRDISVIFQPAKAYVIAQPLGVVGIMVPWNYPLFLAIGPLCQAIAAGNRVMLKMSEFTPNFSAFFQKLIQDNFSSELISITLGNTNIAKQFSSLPFNHLLFTGSTNVGKHVMRAAAENLTPVTLELGGKSPALIGQDADLFESAQRIAFGKSVNSGQTCVAPDYVLIPEARQDDFIQSYFTALKGFYPSIKNNNDYTAIINDAQFSRLQSYVQEAKQHGAKVHYLSNEEDGRKLPHCVITHTSASLKVCQEEIFGPILPIITYETLDQAIQYINERPRPLALYYFGYKAEEQQKVLLNTHSGGVCINETIIHVGQEDLPFGGVGLSGMGNYHGYEGFKTFSHAKAVFARPKLSFMKLVYPPYGKWLQKTLLKMFIK